MENSFTDFGNIHFRQGLLHLIESIEKDANLHPLGRFMVRKMIVNYLNQRLLFVDKFKKEPEILGHPLVPPLIILGLARSGTTLLHNLLAIDPSHLAIPLWLLARPFPVKSSQNKRPDSRKVQMERTLQFRNPLLRGLDSIHYVRANSPEECIIALGLTFNSLILIVSTTTTYITRKLAIYGSGAFPKLQGF